MCGSQLYERGCISFSSAHLKNRAVPCSARQISERFHRAPCPRRRAPVGIPPGTPLVLTPMTAARHLQNITTTNRDRPRHEATLGQIATAKPYRSTNVKHNGQEAAWERRMQPLLGTRHHQQYSQTIHGASPGRSLRWRGRCWRRGHLPWKPTSPAAGRASTCGTVARRPSRRSGNGRGQQREREGQRWCIDRVTILSHWMLSIQKPRAHETCKEPQHVPLVTLLQSAGNTRVAAGCLRRLLV